MELTGNEQRIQALFRELKLADELSTPGFAAMCNPAQSRTAKRRHSFTFSLAVTTAAAVLVVAIFSLWLWSARPPRTPAIRHVANAPAETMGLPSQAANQPQPKELSAGQQHNYRSARPGALRIAARRQAAMLAGRRAEIRHAAAISGWQSPTIALLRSPGDDVLKSLPQLNETVDELKSFLPGRSN
ncbi:MAG: hypothetical protein ABJC05_12085 [Pyrinomonadaceae bacterium]